MLSKKNRLNLKNQGAGFKLIAQTGEVLIKYRKSEGLKGAVVVSKSTAKKAVDRNRIRRIILEALKLSGLSGEYIFIVKKNLADYKRQDIDELLKITGEKISSSSN